MKIIFRLFERVSNPSVNADIRKFTEYIFKDGAAPGKDVVYKNLGYGIDDCFGQRINIEIELPGIGDAAGKTSYLKSGWMIKPDGSLSLNTPFSGFTK